MATHYFVWYRVPGDPAAARGAVNALMQDIAMKTGVTGRLLMRPDAPPTWMEVYESVADAAELRRRVCRSGRAQRRCDARAGRATSRALPRRAVRRCAWRCSRSTRIRATSLVVAANRDEYHARPTAPAAWWDEGWLAGRDLRAGGTWLGVTRAGSLRAADELPRSGAQRSCGAVARCARAGGAVGSRRCRRDARALARRRRAPQRLQPARRNADPRRVDDRIATPGVQVLAPGSYGLSNALLDTPWPKVVRSKAALAAVARARRRGHRAAVHGARRPRHRSRRGAAVDRRHAGVGAPPLRAVHRRRDLRDAQLDGADHRSRRRGSPRRAQLRCRRARAPARSITASRMLRLTALRRRATRAARA